ncbi:YolD-like family protein [Aneurinibacillus tyrosinisolvens]|uniref:YolD-like family protein n=1 Tax=Aneurinibacillus tyrosinisolvens TaxID=1443435 RepID=UPI00063FD25A|nr:YolD-like family protein [Aneurinibacillus tyrosinisolvens]
MINDRGNIKWQGFFLPEHKEMLAQLHEEQFDVEKPELDEQKLLEMSQQIAEAIQEHNQIAITYHKAKRYHSVTGVVEKADGFAQTLHIRTNDGDLVHLPLSSITDIV